MRQGDLLKEKRYNSDNSDDGCAAEGQQQGLQNEAETTAEGERFFRGKMGIRDFAWQVTHGLSPYHLSLVREMLAFSIRNV